MLLAEMQIDQPLALLFAALGLWGVAVWLHRPTRTPGRWMLDAGALLLAVALYAWGTPAAWVGLFVLGGIGAWRLGVRLTRHNTPAGRRRTATTWLRTAALLGVMVLVARPVCRREVAAWQRPLLPVLLDHSLSMAIRDPGPSDSPLPPRADRAGSAIAAATRAIARLSDTYDVRPLRFGSRTEGIDAWTVRAEDPLTGLAAALSEAGDLRSSDIELPAAVVVITDGAETGAESTAVREAAQRLAARRVPLLAAGVGPPEGRMPVVQIEPLAAPPRIGVRDAIRLVVAFRTQGCRDETLKLDVLWDDAVVQTATATPHAAGQRVEAPFTLTPPGPGAHRLAARVTLPESLGGYRFVESTVVDVTDDRIRVLIVERVPQTESAFIARALSGDDRIDVSRRFLFDAGRGGAGQLDETWTSFDVVILGRVGAELPPRAVEALAPAVAERHVGVLLAGGVEVLNAPAYVDSTLAELAPAELVASRIESTRAASFTPTPAGLRHPILAGLEDAAREADPNLTDASIWTHLPPIPEVARLGPSKTAAVVLAQSPDGRPLLVAHAYGGGRCVAAAWDSTWPWALSSDAGAALHKRLWRQLVLWLANRQPQAWVIADRGEYPLAALQNGDRRVQIRIGRSGESPGAPRRGARVPQLTIRRVADPNAPSAVEQSASTTATPIAVRAADDGWRAEWPAAKTALAPGDYELRVSFAESADTGTPHAAAAQRGSSGSSTSQATSAPAPDDPSLVATTRFSVLAEDVERRPPTANLALLREAAALTAGVGGRYADIEELSELLESLSHDDRRRRVVTVQHDDPVASHPSVLLAIIVGALGAEWVIRKRAGLA